MDEASARALARKMARYRVEGERSRELIDDSAVDADLYKILGIEDPGQPGCGKALGANAVGSAL